MPALIVMATLSLGLSAVLLLLVRRRRAEEAGPGPLGGPVDPDDLVSALVVELAVTPEVVKHRRRQQPATGPAAGPAPAAPQVVVPAPGPPRADPAPLASSGAWSDRRSPYASGAHRDDRIALPDDGTDFAVPWRPNEASVADAGGAVPPLARTAQVASTGWIRVEDDDEVVSWRTAADRP